MDYEIVELEEKKVFGLRARTNNQAPDVGAVIGGLWDRFFVQGIYDTIPDKCSGMPLGFWTIMILPWGAKQMLKGRHRKVW